MPSAVPGIKRGAHVALVPSPPPHLLCKVGPCPGQWQCDCSFHPQSEHMGPYTALLDGHATSYRPFPPEPSFACPKEGAGAGRQPPGRYVSVRADRCLLTCVLRRTAYLKGSTFQSARARGRASCARLLHLSCCSENSVAFHPVWGMSLQLTQPRLEPTRLGRIPPATAGDRRDGQEVFGVEGGSWLFSVLQVRSSTYGGEGEGGVGGRLSVHKYIPILAGKARPRPTIFMCKFF